MQPGTPPDRPPETAATTTESAPAQPTATTQPATTTAPATPPPETTSPTAQPPQTAAPDKGANGGRTAKLNLPFVTAEFRAPHLHMPHVHVPTPHLGRAEMAAAAQSARSYLPPPREAAYYGGLVALTVFELIDWPVAVAIGVGTALLGRRRQARREDEVRSAQAETRRQPEGTPAATPTAPAPNG